MRKALGFHRAGPATLLAAALAALPAPVEGQAVPATDQEINNRLVRLGEEIQELEDMKRRIEGENHVVLLSDRGGALVSREQMESFFVTQTFQGRVSGDRIVEYARMVGAGTRMFLQDQIIPRLDAARGEQQRLTFLLNQPPEDRPSLPNAWAVPVATGGTLWPVPMEWQKVQGSLTGRYEVLCMVDGAPVAVTGSFRLILEGSGRATVTFEEGQFQWPAPGTIEDDGKATGEGSGQEGTYWWYAELGRSGQSLTLPLGYFKLNTADGQDRCVDHGGLTTGG